MLQRKRCAVVITLLCLSGCATHFSPDRISDPYGFFFGLWHGAIAVFTITINIVSWLIEMIGIDILKNIQIIGRPNTGFWYYAGFAVGFIWLPLAK
jgi:hypothetical protein